MKIKVGGRYVARNGRVVEIIASNRTRERPFLRGDGLSCAKNGSFFDDGSESQFDLIHEFKDEGAPSKVSKILAVLFWLAVIIGTIGFWCMAAVKLWQMM